MPDSKVSNSARGREHKRDPRRNRLPNKRLALSPSAAFDEMGSRSPSPSLSDTRLGAVEVFIDGQEMETLCPAFAPQEPRYTTQVPTSRDTIACSIFAEAHDPNSVIAVYRWDEMAGNEAKQIAEVLHSMKRRRVDRAFVEGCITLQRMWRGWKVRSARSIRRELTETEAERIGNHAQDFSEETGGRGRAEASARHARANAKRGKRWRRNEIERRTAERKAQLR